MRPARLLATLVLLALALVACDGPVTRPAYVYDAYDITVLTGPAGNGGMAAYVVGDPFPGQEAALRKAVEYALTEQRFGAAFPVTTDPSPELRQAAYKAVVVFDPPTQWDGYAICKYDDFPESRGRRGEAVEVLAIFCQGHRMMTSTQGGIAAASSPEDPRFKALMKQIALTLFPPIRPNGDNDDNIQIGRQINWQ